MFGSIIQKNGRGILPLFDNMLFWMDQSIGGTFATVWFLVLVLYIQCALVAGISQIGLRFLTVVSVHSLEVDGTWMNSFFVNLIIFLCCTFSLVLFVCSNMPKFTANTYVSGLFYVNIRQVSSLAWAFKYRVFEILIVVSGCSCRLWLESASWSCTS